MDDLLREAIADAKAVRETALENAKIALEEAFTPRLQSMLSKKIAAEVEDNDEEMEDEDEVRHESEDSDEMRHDAEEEMDDSDEMRHDKDEMAHEKEEEMEDEDEMRHEGEDKDEVEDEDEVRHEGAHDKDEVEDEDEMRHEAMEDEEEGAHDKEEDHAMEGAHDKDEDDDLDLESVLAELEADLNEEEDEDKDEMREEKVDENDVSSDIGKSDNKVNVKAGDSSGVGQGPEGEGKDEPAGKELDDHEVVKEPFTEVEDKDEKEDDVDEDIDLDEVLKALSEEEDKEEDAHKVEELQAELKETREVVQFMRDKLNEVNLLNAKLLFSNKLFRAFGLNNNQKLKVVETFDRTKNLREVKLVYATLAESFKRPTSKIVESKGSSSKPVRSTKPAKQEVLSEGAELKARFKKLANIL